MNEYKNEEITAEEMEKSPNKFDPRLMFDAFTAGVQDGGLRSTVSIQLLVCYLIASFDAKLTQETIVNAIDEGMIANHFETANAISKLKKSGTINEDADGLLTINNIRQETIEIIEKDLPLSVREQSIRICQKAISKETFKRENKVSIEKIDKGYLVTLHISDKDIDFMTLKLYAGTQEQAELIKDKFITDPVNVYNRLIEDIFSN